MKRIKEFLLRKAKNSLSSSTMGVASALVVVGVWIQQHPDLLHALAGEYEGVALALVGLVVAIARLRTVDR